MEKGQLASQDSASVQQEEEEEPVQVHITQIKVGPDTNTNMAQQQSENPQKEDQNPQIDSELVEEDLIPVMRTVLIEPMGLQEAIRLISEGEEIQKVMVVRNLPNYLDEDQDSCLTELYPLVQTVFQSRMTESGVQCEGARVYKRIMDTNHNLLVHEQVLTGIVHNIHAQTDQVSALAWLEALSEVVHYASLEQINQHVLSIVRSEIVCACTQRRIFALSFIESLLQRPDAESLCDELIRIVQALCQDTNCAVRCAVCQRLPTLIDSIRQFKLCELLMPSLVELCMDEDSITRDCAFAMLSKCIPLFTPVSLTTIIIPLIRKCTEYRMKTFDPSIAVICEHFMPWCHALKDHLSAEDRDWFLHTFVQLAGSGLDSAETIEQMSRSEADALMCASRDFSCDPLAVQCRHFCAHNFPSTVELFDTVSLRSVLVPVYAQLCRDVDETVLTSIAAGFHHIVQMVDSETQCTLAHCFVQLVKSGDVDVLAKLTAHLALILPCLYRSIADPTEQDANGNYIQNPLKLQLDRILLACNRIIRNTSNWRAHESYLLALPTLTACVTEDDMHCTFVPLLKEECLVARALPCRHAAARSLITILNTTNNTQRKHTIMDFFTEALMRHPSCYKRALFVDVCRIASSTVPTSDFKQLFVPHVLKLGTDKVTSVRIKLRGLLPELKQLIIMPDDAELLTRIEAVVKSHLLIELTPNGQKSVKETISHLSETSTMTSMTLSMSVIRSSALTPSNTTNTSPLSEHPPPQSDPIIISQSSPNAANAQADKETPKSENLEPAIETSEKTELVSESNTKLKEESRAVGSLPDEVSASAVHPPAAVRPPKTPVCADRASRLRIHRPRMAVVRPLPQQTNSNNNNNGNSQKQSISERAPSPRPDPSNSHKLSDSANNNSHLPLPKYSSDRTKFTVRTGSQTLPRSTYSTQMNSLPPSRTRTDRNDNLTSSNSQSSLPRFGGGLRSSDSTSSLPTKRISPFVARHRFERELQSTPTNGKSGIPVAPSSAAGNRSWSSRPPTSPSVNLPYRRQQSGPLAASSNQRLPQQYSLMKTASAGDIQRKTPAAKTREA